MKALLLLMCLYALPQNSFSADEKPVRKINLKVGEVLNYQLNETYFYPNDTGQISEWFTFKVIGKKDSLYTLVGTRNKKLVATKNSYSDSRFPDTKPNIVLPDTKQPIPFMLSENGIVQPVVVPDTTIERIIKEKYQGDLFSASIFLSNIKRHQDLYTYYFQRFFIQWHSIKEEPTTVKSDNQVISSTLRDVSFHKDFSEFVSEFEVSPADTIGSGIFSWAKGNSRFIVDENSGSISKMETSTTYTRYKITHQDFKEIDNPQKKFIQIKRIVPENDSTVTITGTLDKNCNSQTLNCFIITNSIGIGEEFYIEKHIEPGKSFRLDVPLKWPIATNLSIGNFNAYSSFLLEPGDSVHLTITQNGVEYSGPGALKSKLAGDMRKNGLCIETTLPEDQAKKKANDWILAEQKKIESFKNQLSLWAYNQIRCDIYYSAKYRLLSYYINRNYNKMKTESFEALFGAVKWNDYHSFSSMDMMYFISTYLNIKAVMIKGLGEYHPSSETEKYYLAKLLFNGKIRYHALSQCVYEALKGNNMDEGRNLFNNYILSYQESGFYPFLKNKLESRVDIGNGVIAPEFEAIDLKGKKVSLEKLKGKYVQLLFVDLEYDDERKELTEYQKLKDLSANKFEMVTIFINKNDSLTKAFIKENKPKGILVSNPDWQFENLKKFKSESRSPYYLVNPKGIIVFSGSGSPTEQFVKMIIDMINSDVYNKAEASVLKSTLYWVLSLSVAAILLTLVVVWLVTRAIKRREAKRREQLELKLGAVRSQLNPHFLFNAMSSIQFLVNHGEKEKANLFLSKFAQLMRKVLLQSETERTPLNDELENIKTYLELESLRHHFRYNLVVDEDIDLYNTEIPVMLLQPFVENAVIHGIAGMEEQGEIEIKVERKNGSHIHICITDNGQGYSGTAPVNSTSNGKGMQITQKRVELMMEKYGHEIAFNIVNRKEHGHLTGTEVCINIETEK